MGKSLLVFDGYGLFKVDARDNARSVLARCKACATPLDFKSS